MTTILTILTEGYADWEIGLTNAVAHGFYGVETLFATPVGAPVTSAAGLKVTPNLGFDAIDFDAIDALVVCGGTIWQTPEAPDLSALLKTARGRGKVVAGICDATLALAKAGLLDSIAHTSNGAGYLDGTGYAGKGHYRDVAQAVSAAGIVTASATMPVTFMVEIMKAIGKADDNLAFYVGMHAAEHARVA